MSVNEQITALLEKIPDYKMGYVIGYLQGLAADEDCDDAFCEKMYQNYLNDPDPEKDQTISGDDLAKELGIVL